VIAGFIYFSESRLSLTLIVALTVFSVSRNTAYSFYILALFTPLLFKSPELLGTNNYSVSELLALTILFVWAARKSVRGDAALKQTSLDNSMILLFIFTLAAAIQSISQIQLSNNVFDSDSPLYPLKVVLDTLAVVLLYFFVSNNFKREYLNNTITFFLIGLVITSVIGLLQYSLYTSALPKEKWFREYEPNIVTSTLNNQNVFGMYLILLIPLALCATVYYAGFIRAILAGVSLLSLCALIVTHSRSALVGLLASLVITSAIRNRRMFVLTVVAIVLAGALALNIKSLRELSIIQKITESGKDLGPRIECYKRVISTTLENPMGVGVGTFRQRSICCIGYKENCFLFHHAHNLYLQLAVERGVFTLGVFLYFLFVLLKGVISVKLDDKYLDAMMWGLTAGVIGILVHGILDYPFYSQRIAILFFFIAGIIESIVKD
jgi:O-antigen ligase